MTVALVNTNEVKLGDERPTLKEELSATVDKFEPMREEKPDDFRARKAAAKEIIDILPEDLLNQVKEHAEYEEELSYELNKPFNRDAVLAGEVFEQLVDVQHNISREMKGEKPLKSQPIEQLKKLIKEPPVLMFEQLGRFRRPDIVDFVWDKAKNRYKLEGEIEAKTGETPIDYRAYKQLQNPKKDLVEFIAATSKLSPLKSAFRSLGFSEIFDVLGSIDVSDNFSKTLYILANRDESKLVNEGDFREKADAERAKAIVKKINIKRSVFSAADLRKMVDVFVQRL